MTEVSGVFSAGLSTMVLLAATAGRIFHAAIWERVVPRRNRADHADRPRRMLLVWSAEYSAPALPRGLCVPHRMKATLSIVPGMSNSRETDRFPA